MTELSHFLSLAGNISTRSLDCKRFFCVSIQHHFPKRTGWIVTTECLSKTCNTIAQASVVGQASDSFLSTPFTTCICTYIQMFPDFFHALSHTRKIFFMSSRVVAKICSCGLFSSVRACLKYTSQ